jgi:hypothetical protein
MKINRTSSNYNCHSGNPAFKQISITTNGQKAIDRIPFYKYVIGKDLDIVNSKHPDTKYWNLVIDGVQEYDKCLKKFLWNPVFKFISKVTGETFENLMIHPPTSIHPGDSYKCASKNHKCLPAEVLLLSSNELVTDADKVKELAFDLKSYDEAETIWHQFLNSSSKDLNVYKALEEMSDKYESSLKIGVDTLLKNNPEYEKEMKRRLGEDNYVWFSDGGIDQWT